VFGLIWWINFDYMQPSSPPMPPERLMQIAGGGGLCWMGIGAFIMAKMINFEI
jgi:tight adherence protein B